MLFFNVAIKVKNDVPGKRPPPEAFPRLPGISSGSRETNVDGGNPEAMGGGRMC